MALLAGPLDDLFRLSKVALIIAIILVSMPIVTFPAGSSLVCLIPIGPGPADFEWGFWILVPFAFAFLMNRAMVLGFQRLNSSNSASEPANPADRCHSTESIEQQS